MKTKIFMMAFATLIIGSLGFWACQEEFPIQTEPEAKTLTDTGEYIVVFKDGVTDVPGLARQLVESHSGEISHIYEYAIRGFAATLSSDAVNELRSHPQIDWIEADQVAWETGLETEGAQGGVLEKACSQTGDDVPWGLDRIDQEELELDGTYNYNQTGEGVSVYIISTGIRFTHDEFKDENGESRAVPGFDYRGGGWDTSDIGRGTSLASVVGGNTFGVAKKATLVSVRVLGPGPTAKNILAGVDWVTKYHEPPAVAFMDLFSSQSDALEAAIRKSITAGVTYVVPDVSDFPACDLTPSGMKEVITVSATTRDDERRTESFDVSCVDLFAPGRGIPSARNESDDDTSIYSGNSWAAAHAAGVAALYLQTDTDARPDAVFAALVEAATPGVITHDGDPFEEPPMLYSLAWEGNGNGNGEPPVADFTYTKDGLKVDFTDNSDGKDSELKYWAWDFGDGNESNEQSPTHTYDESGTYNVTLIVTDDEGATGTTSKEVTVVADENGGDPEPADLSIDRFDLNVTSNRQWARVVVDWEVSGENLKTVELSITGPNSETETWEDLSGNNASGQHEFRFRQGHGEYTVTLTVTDENNKISEVEKGIL